MKIVICVKRDLVGNITLNRLIRELKGYETFIILSDRVTPTERRVRASSHLLFYERDLLIGQIFPLLEAQAQEPAESEKLMTFRQIARRYDIPLNLFADINSAEGIAHLKNIGPDLILSAGFDFILKKPILEIPRLGVFNIHPGELPRYQGVFTEFRAMDAGEKKAACTLHVIDEGIDKGPVIDIRYMDIDYSRSSLWLSIQLYGLGIGMFMKALKTLKNHKAITAVPQDKSKQQYFTFPTNEEFTRFFEKGFKLIDHAEYLDILSLYRLQPGISLKLNPIKELQSA